MGNYQYYLKSDNAFADHYRKEKYKTEAFYVQFPMASLSYGQEIEEQPTYIQDLNFGSLTTTAGEIFNYDQLAGKFIYFSAKTAATVRSL